MVFILGWILFGSTAVAAEMVQIPSGVYQPIYRDKGEVDTAVGPLWIDKTPVTNDEFFKFVQNHPQWSKARAPKIFVDDNYLSEWTRSGKVPKGLGSHPITQISWFAAKAYCEARGARLATIAEWEHAMDIQNPKYNDELLKWYSTPTQGLAPVGQGPANKYGVQDAWGLIWEWVENFSSVIMSGDSRSSVGEDLFCGGAALGSKDPELYAVFLRYAFWSSLKASHGGKRLGFRCVQEGGPL